MIMETGVFNFQGKLQENGSRVITAANVKTDVTINGESEKGTLIVTTEGENDTPTLELNLELPEGPQGPQGPQGEQGETGKNGETPVITWNKNNYTLTIQTGNEPSFTTETLRGPKGDTGPQGRTPLIKIGKVKAVGPNEIAVIDVNENPNDVTLDFKIPKGDKGDTPIFNKNVDVTTLDAGGDATASISSDSSNPNVYTLSLEIPRGDTGAVDNLTVSSNPPDKGFFVEDVSYNYEEGEGETKGDGIIQVQYKTLYDARDELGILNINNDISAINGAIGLINNKINELILVSDTQPYNTSNTQIWFDTSTSDPIGG